MIKTLLKLGGSSESAKKKKVIGMQDNIMPQLPPNFSDEVFNLELEVEQPDVDIVVINRLVELYATAIEYYENIKSDKYQIFKNKTRSLLLKQNVSNAMDKAQEELKTEPNEDLNKAEEKKAIKLKHYVQLGYQHFLQYFYLKSMKQFDLKKDKLELNNDENMIKHRQKELELNMKYIAQQDTKESVKTLMNSHSQDIRHTKKIIQRDTDIQKNLILKRLQMRKIKKHGAEFVDTEENEKTKSDNGGRIRNSFELLSSKNELDMDMIDITTPAKTEPNLSEPNNHSLPKSKEDIMKDFLVHSNYEQMIQQQLVQTKNASNYQDSSQLDNSSAYNFNTSSSNADVVADLFRADQSSSGQKAKKKKVRVSQKSVMEFQLQNSVIPF